MLEVMWTFARRTFNVGSLRVKTHFGIPGGAKLSLDLNETGISRLLLFEFRHYLRAWTITSGNNFFTLHIK